MSRQPRPLRTPSLLFTFLLCLLSTATLAQSAVVLDFKGDRRARLQKQIEASLKELEGISILSSAEWDRAARKEGLTGARADSPGGVAVVAPKVGVAVAVSGKVQKGFRVTLVDASGRELSSRTLRLRKGLLSNADLKRLGRAVRAALEVSAVAPSAPRMAEAAPGGASGSPDGKEEAAAPLAALARQEKTPATDASAREDAAAGDEKEDRGLLGGPPLIRVLVFGTATSRTSCATPRVDSCSAYKRLEPADQPVGRFVEFSTPIPYAGIAGKLELFPFSAQGPESFLQGLGLLASAQRGWSDVNLTYRTEGGEVVGPTVHATDDLFTIEGTWRFGFDVGDVRVYAGPRGGILWRNYTVDDAAEGVLPSSSRRFGAAGVDLGLAISPDLAFELTGAYAFNPTPGADERRRYGEDVDSSGFLLETGVLGRITGPLGYHLRLNLMRFADRHTSAGEEWPEGGSNSELYLGLQIGLSASF